MYEQGTGPAGMRWYGEAVSLIPGLEIADRERLNRPCRFAGGGSGAVTVGCLEVRWKRSVGSDDQLEILMRLYIASITGDIS
jgi:hypothetical protein